MDWFKVEARIGSNEKVHALSDGAFRAFIYLCGYAMQHENGGRVPASAVGLIPRVKGRHLDELEAGAFLHRNGNGWEIHDWEEHQAEALKIGRMRDGQRRRQREYRERQEEEA